MTGELGTVRGGSDDCIAVDDDRVLLLSWQRGFGSTSRVPVEMNWAQIFTLRDGLICRIESYSDRQRAREAVALA